MRYWWKHLIWCHSRVRTRFPLAERTTDCCCCCCTAGSAGGRGRASAAAAASAAAVAVSPGAVEDVGAVAVAAAVMEVRGGVAAQEGRLIVTGGWGARRLCVVWLVGCLISVVVVTIKGGKNQERERRALGQQAHDDAMQRSLS
jgi:hypothetical protein